MIVTHAINGDGHRRVYLGGKASIECWIEPLADGVAWSFHIDSAPTREPFSDLTLRAHANHVLLSLSAALNCSPSDLKAVPFECIAALHAAESPGGRAPAPRRPAYEQVFMATAPGITRPRADFTARDFAGYRCRHQR